MGNYLKLSTNSGASLVATVLALLIFALFIAIAVSLVTTGSNVALQEEQGTDAFYIADGGIEYTIKRNNFPNYSVSPSVNLGDGSFTVSVPTLTSDITSGDTTINVSSTDGFLFNPGDPTRYWIMLCGMTGNPTPDATSFSTCEKISFTNKTAATFTGGVRGRDSSAALPHPAASVVMMYSWDTDPAKTKAISTRPLGRNDNCSTPTRTICVSSTTNLASSGFIRIYDSSENNIEDVFYSGIGDNTIVCGGTCTACLGTNGCVRRAYDGNTRGTVNHAIGTTIWQSEIVVIPKSTGIISNVVAGSIARVVQVRVMPLY